MEDEAVRADELIDECGVRNRTLDELGAGWDCLGPPGEQVVEDGDPCSGFHEEPCHCAADKAGTAGDEDAPAPE